MEKKYWIPLILVGIFFCLLVGNLLLNTYAPYTDDSYWYFKLANNLHDGNGYTLFGVPHAKYPIGYPILINLFRNVFVDTDLAGLMVSVVFGLLCFPLLFYIGKKLFSNKVGLIACVLLALFLPFIFYSSVALSETPFVFFYLGSIVYLILFLETMNDEHSLRIFWWTLLILFVSFAFLLKTSAVFTLIFPVILFLGFKGFFKDKMFLFKEYIWLALLVFLLVCGNFLYWKAHTFGNLFYSDYLSDFKSYGFGMNWQYLIEFPLFVSIPVFLFALLGFYNARKESWFKLFVLLIACAFVLQFFWWSFDLRYLLMLTPLFFLFAAYGFDHVYKSRKYITWLLFLFLITGLLVNLYNGYPEKLVEVNRLLPLNQMALLLTNFPNESIIVGSKGIYGYYLKNDSNLIEQYVLKDQNELNNYMANGSVKYFVFDNILPYNYPYMFYDTSWNYSKGRVGSWWFNVSEVAEYDYKDKRSVLYKIN